MNMPTDFWLINFARVESLWKFKHGRALRSVGQLGVIDLTEIKLGVWSWAKPSAYRIVFEVKHRRSCRRILIKDLLNQEQDSSLLGGLEMQL